MSVRTLTLNDLDWAVDRLAERRAGLVPHAPVLWHSAANAPEAHQRYLSYLLTNGRGQGYRSDTGLLIAAPNPSGWTVDDMVVPRAEWATTGQDLWHAFAATSLGSSVRFVCPVPEPERAAFARLQGLLLTTSWWHRNISPFTSAVVERSPQVLGARAQLVAAPQVYNPGGPVLYLTDVRDPARALANAERETTQLGCPVVVVDQPCDEPALVDALRDNGYQRHCDFLDGPVRDHR